MNRWSASAIAVLLLSLVAYPVTENGRAMPRDSFPLSYYPMFSKDRGKTLDLIALEGVDAEGRSEYLPMEWVGTGGFHQVRKQINRSAELGNLQRLVHIAANVVATRHEPAYQKLQRVQFVRLQFDISDYFAGSKKPVERTVVISVPVLRFDEGRNSSPQDESSRGAALDTEDES